jgi:hypothetical protein
MLVGRPVEVATAISDSNRPLRSNSRVELDAVESIDCRVRAAVFEGRRYRLAALEEVSQRPHRVAQVDIAIVVRVRCLEASRSNSPQKLPAGADAEFTIRFENRFGSLGSEGPFEDQVLPHSDSLGEVDLQDDDGGSS